MAKKSIGDLHATVTADAVQFVSEFKRADNEARRASASIKKTLGQQFGDELGKTGKKFALGFLGAAALGSVVSQLQNVRQNIESIPGVPAETVDSIRVMNYELAQSKHQIDRASAAVLGAFSNLGTSIGIGIGSLIYGPDAAADALQSLNDEAREFARSGFKKEFAQLSSELDRLKLGVKGEGSSDLQKEADVLAELATTGVLNLKEYTNAKLEALNTQFGSQGGASQADIDNAALESLRAYITLQRERNTQSKAFYESLKERQLAREQDNISIKSTTEQLKALKKLMDQNRSEANKLQFSDPDFTRKLTELGKQAGDIERKIFQVTSRVRSAGEEMRDAFAGSFDSLSNEIADFVIDGEFKLSNFTDTIAKQIISTFVKLAVINPLLNGMFGASNGWTALPSMFGKPAADGGFRDGSKPYLVGEEGPEIFNPGGAGTIIPNHKLASAVGGGGGNTYHIDARGADMAAVARLERSLVALAGPGVVEKRAKAAISDERRRGGGMGRGLGS